MATTMIKINGMTCGHCTSAVEEALSELEGVDSVVADLETGEVSISHNDSVDEARMAACIEDIGFELA